MLSNYKGDLIEATEVIGIYLNARLNVKNLFIRLFSNLDENYGFEKTDKPKG